MTVVNQHLLEGSCVQALGEYSREGYWVHYVSVPSVPIRLRSEGLSEQPGVSQLCAARLGPVPRQPGSGASAHIHCVPQEETEAPRG